MDEHHRAVGSNPTSSVSPHLLTYFVLPYLERPSWSMKEFAAYLLSSDSHEDEPYQAHLVQLGVKRSMVYAMKAFAW